LEKREGRMIAVLGATGRRDKTKRPIMGALAGRYADLVIFTDEDPYDENPTDIMEEVADGIRKGGKKNQWRLNRNYWKVIDRKQAIKKALREAKKGDVVLEGQLASWMAKDFSDFNIYVTASLDVRVKRIADRDKVDFNKAKRETVARTGHPS